MSPTADPALLRRIAGRIDDARSVARRSGGIAGTVSTYLPGERLLGMRATGDGRLVVHVVMRWGFTVDDVEEDIVAAVGADWPSGSVDIGIDDIELAEDLAEDTELAEDTDPAEPSTQAPPDGLPVAPGRC